MCAGAILNARIPAVIYGARDPKAGSLDSIQQMYALPYNHSPQVISGVLEAECAQELRSFFRALRAKKKRAGSVRETAVNVDKAPGTEYDNKI